MKNFLNNLKNKLINFGKFLKQFFSYWRNCVLVISAIASIVFFCLWNVADWCKLLALIFSSIALLIISIMATLFYRTFVAVLESQKQQILENLAVQFDKEEYLELKTPFNETEEKLLTDKVKFYKYIMIVSWVVFALMVYLLIAFIF